MFAERLDRQDEIVDTVETGEAAVTPRQRDVYTIPARNMGKFEAKFAKIARKARRFGENAVGFEIVEAYDVKIGEDVFGEPVYETCYRIRLTAEIVKVRGYTFVATVDHMNLKEAGANIIRAMPDTGIDIPASWRTAKPFCVHCNRPAFRKTTMLFCEEATGNLVQIGRNCVADFMGRDPHDLAARSEFMRSFSEGDDDEDRPSFYYRDDRHIDVPTFLGHAAAMIRIYGWIPGSMASDENELVPTRERARFNMFPPKDSKTGKFLQTDPVIAEDKALAEQALAWAKGLADKPHLGDYEHTISVIARVRYMEHKSLGFAASIVSSYLKAMERLEQAKREAKALPVDLTKSVHVGGSGERLNFGPVRVIGAYSGLSGQFFVYRYRFLTAEGNVITWKASKSQNLLKGQEVMLTGTITGYDEWEGVKRTKIARAKVGPVSALPLLDEKPKAKRGRKAKA